MTHSYPEVHLTAAGFEADGSADAVSATLRTIVEYLASVDQDLQGAKALLCQLAAQLQSQQDPRERGSWPVPAPYHTSIPRAACPGPEQPPLRIACFGSFEVHYGAEASSHQGKGMAILKYLASQPRQPIRRDVLLEGLWPQVDPNLSNNRLKVALHHLRQSWGSATLEISSANYIIFRDGCYGFNPHLTVWTDVEAFEQAWQTGARLERAGALAQAIPFYRQAQEFYRGDFLEADRFEEWTLVRREALKDIYLTILDTLSHYWLQRSDFGQAIGGWQEILAKDPWREDVYRHLMSACAASGQRGLALHWYDRCVQILQAQLGLDPESETLALYQQIRHGAESGA